MSSFPLSLLLLLLLLIIPSSSPFPQCIDLRSPATLRSSLSFCPYNNGSKACCSPSQDLQIKRRYLSMNVSHFPDCASALKSILCAACDPFSAKLVDAAPGPGPRPVPVLCNSTAGNGSFCSTVWKACRTVPILNSPFAPALQTKARIPRNATSSTLADLWESESSFCSAFGGDSTCYDGGPVRFNETDEEPGSHNSSSPAGICLEKIGNGSFINMAAHPDGSGRAFFSTLAGKIYLAEIPDQDSRGTLGIDESRPFVDLTDQISLGTSYGMMGMAFHPDFANNGRFFASFNCDREKSPGCGGRCACNSDVGCDPSELGVGDNSDEVCKYNTVVAEYSANGTASTPATAGSAKPIEVRRIFTMGLPFGSNHGGQILFGPADGHLYLMMGDGGSKGDPYNFAQNKKSLLGKIIRMDVNNFPSVEEIVRLGRWGNYSVPQDNPFSNDKEMEPEIWAYGLRNPWRCSFDAERPAYFLCADTGEDQYEEVNIITKGGNYGWRVYEGPIPFKPIKTPGGNTSADSIDPIFPVAGYNHAGINKLGSAAISGGYFYRAQTDPCMYGSYLYADLYAAHIWAASETPINSGNFTTKDTPFGCSHDSPIKCDSVPNTTLPSLMYIFSFGQDNKKDVYILTQGGVYRVVRPSRCNYACSKEVVSPRNGTSPTDRSLGRHLQPFSTILVVLICGVGFLL